MNRTLLSASVGALTFFSLTRTAHAQTLGMVADDSTHRVTVFDADSNTVLGSVDVPGFRSCFGDCIITPDRQLGFVTNFEEVVWVIDLSGGAPVLAGGTNPIPVSTPGEDLAISLDGKFLLVGDGAADAPLSVVDIATRAEVSTFPIPGFNCTSVEVCADGSILATSTTSTTRLSIDGAGNLTDTGDIIAGSSNLVNLACAPGAATAIVFDFSLRRAVSFTVPGLNPLDLLVLGDSPLCGAVHPDGDRLYVRTHLLEAFAYDSLTGDIGALIFSIDPGPAASCYGIDQLAVHPDGDRFYLTQLGGIGVYDAADGHSIATIDGPNLFSGPSGIYLRGEPRSLLCIDFESDDTGAPMPHGTRVDTEFDGDGGFPTITGSLEGSGLNTLAILNSDTGPAAQDPDLLVGTGNILILQTDDNLSECPPASGIFCSHNDDEDGGTMSLGFDAPIEAASIVLIDVDAGDGPWRVLLTDPENGQRIYSVPAGWTEDGGVRTLDLTTLAPQPGFAAAATASESAGFVSARVQRIDVELGASGAIDDVCVFSSGANLHQHPSVLPRNGSGVNSVTLSPLTLPFLGETWSAQLDCSRYGPALAVLEVRSGSIQGRPSPFGEILIGGELLARIVRVPPQDVFDWPIPNSVALAGVSVHAQGLCSSLGPSGSKLRFARGGLSNALDLVLGD